MASSTVRQTVTTIQQSRSGGATSPILDNNLDALLEDLQTSVSRPSSAMNGMTSGSTGAQIYREVTTRTLQQDKSPANRDVQVQYLSAANPTTFVSERAASPGMVELLQQQQLQQQQQQQLSGDQRAMAYKTVSYQYNTSSNTSGAPITGLVVDGTPVRSTSPAVDTASDARLQQNLNELDSLLVDLHHAQKTGFGTDQAGPVHGGAVTTTTRTITGVDPGLLEPIDHSTPTPPTRQQIQQITRTVQQRTYVDGGGSSPSPARYSNEAQSSPRLQPKRSSSANRELTYGTVETQHRTRSPSPSPRVPQRAVVQKDTYYETKNSTTPKQERYRDKSPTNRRLQRELYYESKSSAVPPSPRQDRYRDPSPPAHRRGTSPMQYPSQPAPEVYPNQPGGSSKVTTIRTYNYSTSGQPAPSPVPPVSRSPYPSSGAPSPAPVVVELPHRSPSPYGTPQGTTTTTYDSPSGTKVTTTVRTYTYELPGQPGSNQPYPPNHDPNRPPVYDPNDFGPVDRTLTYQVSPPPPREKEPLLDHPQQTPPPTVITYKYSSHSSHSTSSKFPQHPEEQQPLLPRPFPTPSPTPVSTVDGQPPKRLDELMASFSDTEIQHREPHPPVGYYVTEKHPANARPQHPETVNGVAVPPANVQASAAAGASANASAAANAKDRPKTKNVAGPPVYYPPGVELFAKKEESMMAGKKASGRYEYEYESKSKSKSSSSGGAAVVPVCLPLCCAMPCVIL